MKPVVSVVVPVYNAEKYIDSCMEQLLNQTYPHLEIILMNDGSKDGSAAICDEYAKKDSRVTVHHQENKGVSATRNAGIRLATGKYIVFFDVDDTVEKTVIEDNVKLAEQHQADVTMFCFWYYDVDSDRLKANGMEEVFVGSAEEYFDRMLIHTIDNEMFNPPWNKMIRRELLERNGLFFNEDCSIYEDIMFACQLFGSAQKIVINNQMYYKYFLKSSGSLITKFYENFYDYALMLHQNAMQYCGRYKHNSQQITRFNTLFTKLVITHMKQISCNKQLSKERKYQLLEELCEKKEFLEALENSNLGTKKKFMRYIIGKKKYRHIYVIYKIINKL